MEIEIWVFTSFPGRASPQLLDIVVRGVHHHGGDRLLAHDNKSCAHERSSHGTFMKVIAGTYYDSQ